MKAQGTVEAYMCLTLVSVQLYWINSLLLLLSPLPVHSPSLHFLLLLAEATSAAVVISVYLFTLEASNVFSLPLHRHFPCLLPALLSVTYGSVISTAARL